MPTAPITEDAATSTTLAQAIQSRGSPPPLWISRKVRPVGISAANIRATEVIAGKKADSHVRLGGGNSAPYAPTTPSVTTYIAAMIKPDLRIPCTSSRSF
ncbi:MAG: hypothetical protein NZM04_09760 [Methylacidiphilales bacterium]|nr:hypothetical protein [Candidatus Methylacidiphilales bacterium]